MTTAVTLSMLAADAKFASGTVLLFYQAAAPTGWVQVVTQNDKALRVVSGATGGTAGGTTAFSTVFASRTPAGSLGGSTASYTLTTTDIPIHSHANTLSDPGHSHAIGDPTHFHRVVPAASTVASSVFSSTVTQSTANGLQSVASSSVKNCGSDWASTGVYTGGTGTGMWINNANAGGGGGHSHGATGLTFSGSAMDFAVQYINVILASKS